MVNFSKIFKLLSFVSLLSKVNCGVINVPQCGNIYRTKFRVPFIGHQIIETEFKMSNSVYIKLDGLIKENGTVKYYNIEEEPIVEISSNLENILKKFNIEYSYPHYDNENDCIIFEIYVKKINFSSKIKMINIIE